MSPMEPDPMHSLLVSQLGQRLTIETSLGQQRVGELVELRDGFAFLRSLERVADKGTSEMVLRPMRVAVPIEHIAAVSWPEEA